MYIRLVLCTLCEHTANQPTRTHTDERTTLRRRWDHQPAGQSWKEGGGNGFGWFGVQCCCICHVVGAAATESGPHVSCCAGGGRLQFAKQLSVRLREFLRIEKIKYKQRTWLIAGEKRRDNIQVRDSEQERERKLSELAKSNDARRTDGSYTNTHEKGVVVWSGVDSSNA